MLSILVFINLYFCMLFYPLCSILEKCFVNKIQKIKLILENLLLKTD